MVRHLVMFTFRRTLPILTALSVFCVSLTASASLAQTTNMTLTWDALKTLVRTCAVQPYSYNAVGRKVFGKLESVCSHLRILDPQTVEFDHEGETYRGVIQESPHSDGGDLQDVVIVDAQGAPVLSAETVLAFNDPLLALTLGDSSGLLEKQR